MKRLAYTIVALFIASFTNAQVRINDPGRAVERSVENRANRRVNQGIDRGLDKVEEGIWGALKKKSAKPKQQSQQQTASNDAGTLETQEAEPGMSRAGTSGGAGASASGTLKAYSKFDFVPGEQVLVTEDFMQDAVGDFPARWNTNSSGEIVTIEGKPGRWLSLNKQGQFLPEFITNLPDNFTIQFDLACTSPFSFYSSPLYTTMAVLKNPAKDFTKWGRFGHGEQGVTLRLHPTDAGGQRGKSHISVISNNDELVKNDVSLSAFYAKGGNFAKVSIWRQKQRLRVYVNEEKVWDLPRAFQPDQPYNSVVFAVANMHDAADSYYISNLRLAVGAPDTRNKLITEGKFVTRGILFDPNSDKIKPESFGALKDIANVLTENADVRVLIVGHTDADGDDATNLSLSKRRAEAVKTALGREFGIDTSRLSTDGKGESQPSAPNTTPEGKANNRRVEFIKQ